VRIEIGFPLQKAETGTIPAAVKPPGTRVA
jgi:hypothetical protein